jgi:hypothetical protein
MKVGPTERIGFFSDPLSAAGAGLACALAVGALAVVAAGALAAAGAPFLPAPGGGPLEGGRDIFFALSSVTMMSPCCSAAALSSTPLNASDHVWPAALHEQDGLNS